MQLAALLTEFPRTAGEFGALPDDALMDAVRELETVGRAVDQARSLAAAEIAHRSDPALGYAGLAVRQGHRTPDRLVATLTGTTRGSAAKRVRVGVALADPVLAPIESLGTEQADVIVRTLGDLPATPERAAAIDLLVNTAPSTDADTLALQARAARESLEQPNALDAEAALRSQRFLRIGPEIDGMRRLSGNLDPESAGHLLVAFDAATNPRRGGPRFVDPEAVAHAERLVTDERTDDQLRLDALVDLVRAASAIGHKPVLGTARPAVRVVIAMRDLESALGAAHIDGVEAPISAATARRMACSAGLIPVVLGADGEVLDVGRASRPFTPVQRLALAVRDGGCLWFGCDRPPSWCEAHHIEEWSHGGDTSLENGVLLCRHHHLLLHNNGWQMVHTPDGLAVKPPRDVDPLQRLVPLPSKSRVVRQLQDA